MSDLGFRQRCTAEPVRRRVRVSATPETTVHRHPERGATTRPACTPSWTRRCSVMSGFVADGRAVVIPCIQARIGETLYLHGAVASRLMQGVASGDELCVTATLIDGLVAGALVVRAFDELPVGGGLRARP